jgi:small-conductance mechanosensitive channel
MDLDTFFAREPLGFSTDTFRGAWEDLLESLAFLGELAADWWGEPVADRVGTVVFLLGVVLISYATVRLDRKLRKALDAWSRHFALAGPDVWVRCSRVAVRVAGTVVVPGLLLVLSYVPLRGLFGAAEWTYLVTHVLILWITFRVLARLAREIIRPDVIEMTVEHAALNRRVTIGAVWLIVVFQVGKAVLVDLESSADSIALVDFMLRLSLTLLAVRVVFMKSALLDLLPDVGPSIYLRFREVFARFYVHIVAMTAVLSLMWTFGYAVAAETLLARAYTAIGFLIVVSLLLRFLQSRLEPEDGEVGLFKSMVDAAGSLLRFFILVIAVVVALRIVGLYEAVVGVLDIPLVTFDTFHGSVLAVFNAVVVFLGFLLCSRLARRLMELRLYPALEIEDGVAYAISAMAHYFLLITGVVAGLLSTGLDLSTFGIFAGALGVGIGFGLQDIVRNLVAGFVLLFGQAVKKGDYITVGEQSGQVETLGARSIRLRTRDNISLLVPCADIVNGTITNWTHRSPQIRMHIVVGVSYNAEPKDVQAALIEAANAYAPISNRPVPRVWLVRFADSAVEYELVVWVNVRKQGRRRTRGELNFLIWDKLHEAGIEIPYPQRDLHIKTFEPEVISAALLGT